MGGILGGSIFWILEGVWALRIGRASQWACWRLYGYCAHLLQTSHKGNAYPGQRLMIRLCPKTAPPVCLLKCPTPCRQNPKANAKARHIRHLRNHTTKRYSLSGLPLNPKNFKSPKPSAQVSTSEEGIMGVGTSSTALQGMQHKVMPARPACTTASRSQLQTSK